MSLSGTRQPLRIAFVRNVFHALKNSGLEAHFDSAILKLEMLAETSQKLNCSSVTLEMCCMPGMNLISMLPNANKRRRTNARSYIYTSATVWFHDNSNDIIITNEMTEDLEMQIQVAVPQTVEGDHVVLDKSQIVIFVTKPEFCMDTSAKVAAKKGPTDRRPCHSISVSD